MRNFNFLIEHQCPQCGAPAVLTETDRLFQCEFCRTRSYLLAGDYFRYILPSKAPESKPLVYFPYWRFKGMLFGCVPGGVRNSFVDVSQQADRHGFLPNSLGFRSQTLNMRFFTPDLEGRFLVPAHALQQAQQIVNDRFKADMPRPIYHLAHIGESLSLIYAPYYFEEKLIDAVLDEPVAAGLPENVEDLLARTDRPDWRLQFLPVLCPKCGWDLQGERDALVLLCRNCNSAWQAGGDRFKALKYAHWPATGEEGQVLYLPFWRIQADLDGVDLQSYADLVRVANLPRVVQPEWDKLRFRFWTLAFKIRPQTFLPLATRLTLSQPQQDLNDGLPEGDLYPVNLSVEEAVESLKVILASFIRPRSVQYPRLPEIKIMPKTYLLVYVPFARTPHELIQSQAKLVILKNQLTHAKNL